MKTLTVFLLNCTCNLVVFCGSPSKNDTIKSIEYVTLNKDFEKNYGAHINYCKFARISGRTRWENFNYKKINKLLMNIDTLDAISLVYIRKFRRYNKIPALRKVNKALLHYKYFNDTGIFSLKNLEYLSITMERPARMHIPTINSSLTGLHTWSEFDSSFLNLKALDSLHWEQIKIDSISSHYISLHPHLYYLKINVGDYFASKNDIADIIKILKQSQKIRKLTINTMRYEEGALTVLREFCEINHVDLLIPDKYLEKSLAAWQISK